MIYSFCFFFINTKRSQSFSIVYRQFFARAEQTQKTWGFLAFGPIDLDK